MEVVLTERAGVNISCNKRLSNDIIMILVRLCLLLGPFDTILVQVVLTERAEFNVKVHCQDDQQQEK